MILSMYYIVIFNRVLNGIRGGQYSRARGYIPIKNHGYDPDDKSTAQLWTK